MSRTLLQIISITPLLFLFCFVSPALAVDGLTQPTFPSCLNPQGTLIVNYSEGTHGIVGESVSYSGSDQVYRVSDSTLTQCFCSVDGDGIQTNWWKTGSLSQSQIDTLKNLGWYLIPDGSLWGLEKTTYMAKNENYSCLPGGTGGGEVLGTTTSRYGQVLGLATTGNLDLALFSLFAGVGLLFVSGRFLNR
jgi:hypothetical protein